MLYLLSIVMGGGGAKLLSQYWNVVKLAAPLVSYFQTPLRKPA